MDVLNAIINSHVSTDQVLEWLTADNPETTPFSEIVQTDSTKVDFILYFLNYLKKQCQSILHVGTNDALEGQHRTNISSTPTQRNERRACDKTHEKLADNIVADRSIESALTSTPLKTDVIHNSNISDNTSLTPCSVYLSKNESNAASNEGTFNILNESLHSSPILKHNSHVRSFNQSTNAASNDGNFNLLNQSLHSSPIVKHDSNVRSFNQSTNTSNFMDSFPELSNSSQKLKNVSISDSFIFNSSITNNSLIPGSPISPLYTANMPSSYSEKINILTPKHKPLKNKSTNDPSPPQNPNNRHKKNKSNQNRSLCLGDFLNFEVSTKKNGRRSYNKDNKITTKDDGDENTSIDEGSSDSAQKSKSKKRIKPTKLHVSLNSDSPQKQVFGVVSRPAVINPQFSEALPKDKSNETTSFEVERGLLKLERQRQPKFDVPEIVNQETTLVNRLNPPTVLYILPKPELVENKETLNILAKLYSGLLNKNLVPNLMTELYFIISLLTSQYKSSNDELTTQIEEEESINVDSILENSLEQLKENLGCMDLNIDDETEKLKNCNRSQKSLIGADDFSLNDTFDSTKENGEDEKSKENLETISKEVLCLTTAHNCVYFATTVLANGINLLIVLDRMTLKLLSENYFILSFQKELQKDLNELYEEICQQSKLNKPYTDLSASKMNVCFQIDTDNRENFPSNLAFSTFRKQRDLFYEFLKMWEDNHLNPKWSLNPTLERKINTMLSMHPDTANYYHIARLFKSQLLMSSIENKQTEQEISDESLSILKDMMHLNPDKLKQLKERLVTPVISMCPVPPPAFPGVQEFYREFLCITHNLKFLTILKHCFIQEIMELNEAQFSCSDIDAKGSTVDESTKQNYLLGISSLRLMAKFLGLLESMPYRPDVNSLNLINTQVALRSRVLPPLDLQKCLCDAVKHGKLSLTIPWMVQYLAMLDSISFRLPYYLHLCELLYCIYRAAAQNLNRKTAFLITFSIGWFFEQPNFPTNLYWNLCTNYDSQKIVIVSETMSNINNKDGSSSTLAIENSKDAFKEQNMILDQMEIIDDRTLYACCPFLKVFRALLTSGNSNLGSNNNANRHITPVSSQLSLPSSATKAITLQLQLEEAFFHGHPKSVKNTVDFVAERVTSTSVKYICQSVIPKVKKDNLEAWIKIIRSPTASKKMDDVTTFAEGIKECREDIIKMTDMRTTKAIEPLLAEDIRPAVKDMCIKIARRMAMERIDQWIDSYIKNAMTSNSIYENISSKTHDEGSDDQEADDIKKEICEIHNPQAPCATTVINELRSSLWELIEKHGRWTVLTTEQTLLNIDGLKKTLYERNDTRAPTKKVLYTMSVDYALHLIVFGQELITPDVENNFIDIWKRYDCAEILFSNLLCPRNVKLLFQSVDKSVWSRYGKFIGRLLIENILSLDKYIDQCVALLRTEWPPVVLKQLPDCLMETINCIKSTNVHMEKIKFMIEWIAETCVDLNSEPVSNY